METSKVWNTCVDPSSGRRYWYNKLTGHRTWKQPSEQDNVTRIDELKPDLRDLVVQRRLTKALKFFEKRQERELAGLRTVPMRDVKNNVAMKQKSSLKKKDTNEICGKYEHRSRRRTETVVMKVELRPDHQFTYSQDRTKKGIKNRVYGTGTWSLVPGSQTQSLQLRLDGQFITDGGSVLTQVRNYPFGVLKKEISRRDVDYTSSRMPPRIPHNETPMERKARVIDESTDRELTMRVAGDSILKQIISEGKNESLLFALGLRK